jgi:CubicO group peptidase (beta-lactamase class C family)
MTLMRPWRVLAWAVFIPWVASVPVAWAQALPLATPEAVGLSAQRLQRVDDFIARLQREDKLVGAVTVVARRGKLVSMRAHGLADREAGRAMRIDDVFHIQSMTKPVATVAALMLLEEGRFLLSDPVARFLPEFRDIKVAVARAGAPGGFELVPAQRPITILDLLTHRAGFTGLPPRESPAQAQWRETAKALPQNGDFTLEQFVKLLATSPLEAQPGAEFRYGAATIVLGRLIEVVTGQSLADALRDRVFTPLAMTDTFFTVPADKRSRVVPPYTRTPGPGLTRLPLDSLEPRFLSAGGNLFSTPADYLRFCQMLLNGGELDGKRLLSRKSVELMLARQVESIPLFFMPGQYLGLGVAVSKPGGDTGLLGSPGTYGWGGAYNTYFRIDPQEKLILMLFTQLMFSPFDLELEHGFHNTVMQAIND